MKMIDFPDKPVIGLHADSKLEKQDILELDQVVTLKLDQFDSLEAILNHQPYL